MTNLLCLKEYKSIAQLRGAVGGREGVIEEKLTLHNTRERLLHLHIVLEGEVIDDGEGLVSSSITGNVGTGRQGAGGGTCRWC